MCFCRGVEGGEGGGGEKRRQSINAGEESKMGLRTWVPGML